MDNTNIVPGCHALITNASNKHRFLVGQVTEVLMNCNDDKAASECFSNLKDDPKDFWVIDIPTGDKKNSHFFIPYWNLMRIDGYTEEEEKHSEEYLAPLAHSL